MTQSSIYTLLADVGGTHTRCAAADKEGVRDIAVFNNAEFDSLQSLLSNYVEHSIDGGQAPDNVILGVAGLVKNKHVKLLNREWAFSADDISSAVGARTTRLVNDFEALAYSLSVLSSEEKIQCGGTHPIEGAPKAVLGPGTGLGVSSAVWTGQHWLAVAGEGGHVSLAASNEREIELCKYLRSRFGHASAERALSGAGLTNIYHFVSGETLEPVNISKLAHDGDAQALEVFELFFGLLGSVAGNLALTLGASGGVYVAGGIIKKNRAILDEDVFRQRFDAKGRYSGYLQSIPVYWITSETPALAGLDYLRRHAHINSR